MGLGEELEKTKEVFGDGSWLDKIESAFQNFSAGMERAATNLSNLSDKLTSLTGAFGKIGESSKSASDGVKGVSDATVNTASNIQKALFDIFGAAEGFDSLGGAALSSSASIGESYKAIGEHTEELTGLLGGIAARLGAGDITKFFDTVGKNLSGAGERTQELEKAYLSLNAASGEMGRAFTENGRLIGGSTDTMGLFADRMATLNKRIQDTASATGMAPKEIAKSLTELSTIPAALDNSITIAGKSMDSLTAASKIAAGSMQDTSQVINDMRFAYDTLSGSTEKQIEYASNLASAQQALHLPMSDVRDAVQQTASTFAMMSDNVDDTVKAMGLIIPAMEGVGLSGHQATKVFGDIMGAMSGLSDATESYVSTMSGGPGGLQGVFAFEEKLAKDKEGAARDLMKTLKESVGGEIVTRAEAAADISGQAASQYEKQREMWEKITGKKLDKGEEAKVFEAMKKGAFEGKDLEGTMATGAEAKNQVGTRGQSVQEAMVTSVTEIRNQVNRIAAAQDLQVGLDMLRKDKEINGPEIVNHMRKMAENTANDAQPGKATDTNKSVGESFGEGKDYIVGLIHRGLEAYKKSDAEQKKAEQNSSNPPLSRDEQEQQVTKNIRATTSENNPAGLTANNVKAATETQTPAATTTQQNPIAISVTGEIKGMCIKCQQETMIDDVAAVALNKSNNQDVLKRSGPLRNG